MSDNLNQNMNQNMHLRRERESLQRDIARLRDLRFETEVFVKSYLPTPFVQAYQELCDDLFRGVGSGLGNVSDMPRAPRSNQKGLHHGGLKDTRKINQRKNIDRRLRALARDIRSAGQEPLRCSSCAKFIEDGWKHCAWCGKGLNRGDD